MYLEGCRKSFNGGTEKMKALILWGIGMSGGIAVAAGLFTFLVITGIPHRLMTITHTTAYGGWYEWMFVLGGALGNAVWLTDTAVKILPVPLQLSPKTTHTYAAERTSWQIVQ